MKLHTKHRHVQPEPEHNHTDKEGMGCMEPLELPKMHHPLIETKDGAALVLSCFLPGLVAPATGIATFDDATNQI